MLSSLRESLSTLGSETDNFGLDTLRESFDDVDRALDGVESVLGSLRSWDAPLAADAANHLVTAGGKRLRPALLFLAYGAAGGEDLSEAKPYAVGAELIHTATLLHDDVIDADDERRGVETANERFGTVNAVLSGDYLVAHVINELLDLGRTRPVKILAEVMTQLTQGEILQDEYANDLDLTRERYLQVARLKTSSLFSYSAWCGAYLPEEDEPLADDLGSFAEHLGIAFQIVDDVLDYRSGRSGKTSHSDLKDGKINYPMILALERDPTLRSRLEDVNLKTPLEEDRIQDIQESIEKTNALDQSREDAREHSSRARACLAGLSGNRYVDALETVTEYVFKRFS